MKTNLIFLIILLAFLRQGTSTTCADDHCKTCTAGGGKGTCTGCSKGGWYLDSKTSTCLECPPGKTSGNYYSYTSADQCTDCEDLNCDRCWEWEAKTGVCYKCSAGYNLIPGKYPNEAQSSGIDVLGYCTNCEDANCATCSGSGTGKCQTCASGYRVKAGKCVACKGGNCDTCEDDHCSTCTPGGETGTCTECQRGGWYLDSDTSTCLSCPIGKTSSSGYTSADECTDCQDLNCDRCYEWEGKTDVCYKCATGYSLLPGQYPNAGKSVGIAVLGTCSNCDDANCATCSGKGTGKCKTCAAGYRASAGKCLVCRGEACNNCDDANCKTCPPGGGTGTCTECEGAGWYLDSDTSTCLSCPIGKTSSTGSTSVDECRDCQDLNCDSCYEWEVHTDVCYKCSAGYYLIPGKYPNEGKRLGIDVLGTCVKCKDTNCLVCTGAGNGKCTSCAAGYYLDSSSKTCKACSTGQFSADGDNKCTNCADENCNTCDGAGLNQCSVCAIGTYLDSKTSTCTSCGNGKTSSVGSTSSSACEDCGVSNCATCNTPNTCTSCNANYYVPKQSATCSQCQDSHCDICSPSDASKCLTCAAGYKVGDDGKTCTLVSGLVYLTIVGSGRYDMTMEQYAAKGGDKYYISNLSKQLNIDEQYFEITKVSLGSVIIAYKIKSTGGSLAAQKAELEKLKADLDQAMKSGTMNLFDGAKVLNYQSGIVIITEENESEEKKSKNLGAILGGILGGAALIVAIGLSIGFAYKKGYFKKSAKSPASAKQDMLKVQPISPDSTHPLKGEI